MYLETGEVVRTFGAQNLLTISKLSRVHFFAIFMFFVKVSPKHSNRGATF